MRFTLKKIESNLQHFFESTSGRLFPKPINHLDLADLMNKSLQEKSQQGLDGFIYAPNLFLVFISSIDLPGSSEILELQETFSALVYETGTELGYHFLSPPQVRIDPDPSLLKGEIRIEARNSLSGITPTTEIDLEQTSEEEHVPQNAFLIINGTELIPLKKTVVNIGRRNDNNIILDDPYVSRLHAQLRATKGCYAIFDLSSSGGTKVNGQSIHHQILKPGDVIQISTYLLVYGQDDLE
jgi:hypothetical protein